MNKIKMTGVIISVLVSIIYMFLGGYNAAIYFLLFAIFFKNL